ncbi:hypothetical protein [Dictyobacter arantiisoli]|uniref:Uncharacterized protein n=1 Tax=Dictyobacter arantiisoli TaxID=2014874 RepID=A0A5A5T826_9CHLR|nr:hypothetical protein [Dictyobacter arantiisoli]GCF07104.1 hypothetical protein KDI_06680 [Dictyobacter arantiisoli]
MIEGSGNSKRASRGASKFWSFKVLLLLCFVVVVVGAGALSLKLILPARASDSSGPAIDVNQLNKVTLGNMSITHNLLSNAPSTAKTAHSAIRSAVATASSTDISLPYNNVGTMMDQGTTTAKINANFDGGGASYSQNALIQSGLYSGASWYGNSNYQQQIVLNGTTFNWPDVALGAPDNVSATGQTILVPTVANATSLGFIGAATGTSSGNVTVRYQDNSTQTFSLSFDDWTLGGGNAHVSSFDKIAAAMSYRDRQGGVAQTVKTYLFYTGFNLRAGATVQSITLPNKSSLHIFAAGFGLASYYDPYKNVAVSDNANTSAANIDGGGYSYSMQELSRYILPGDVLNYNGTQLYWPNVLAGSPDNITANGQTFTFNSTYANNKTKIGFIGTATGGASCGNITISFIVGNPQTYNLCMDDWTLGGSKQYPIGQYFFGFPGRNTASGSQQSVKTYLFYYEIALPVGSANVVSVTFPSSTHAVGSSAAGGQMHFLSFGLGSGTYNANVGTTFDSSTHIFGNLDGGHNSYSVNAMQKAGVVPVTLTTQAGYSNYLFRLNFSGATFYWDQNGSVLPDNLVPTSSGQTISLNNPMPNEDNGTIPVNPVANATYLAILGSSTGGTASGSIIIYYSDGTGQKVNINFSDWCAQTPVLGDYVALNMSYRNTATGSQTIANHLYYTDIRLNPVSPGLVPVSIYIPAATSGGQMHIFSVALK